MIGNLLFKIGVFKVSRDEAKDLLYKMHENLAESINLQYSDDVNSSEQKAEVKMFFWFMGGLPLIPKYQDKPFFQIVHNNIYEVIFSEVLDEINNDEHFLTHDDISEIYDSRHEFYKSLRTTNSTHEIQRLLKTVSEFIYTSPFVVSENETNDFLSGMLDFTGGMEKTIYISSLLKNVVPTYNKSMKRLFKLVK